MSCSSSVSLSLGEGGYPPTRIDTKTRVHLRVIDGAPTVQQIDLDTVGTVPGLDLDAFREHAEQAKASCTISRALGGVEKIDLTASLAP